MAGKVFKLLLIIFIPAILFDFIYLRLSPSVCFTPTSDSLPKIEKFVSDNLNSEYKKIQNISPLIQFGNDWFKYDVSIENRFKVALVIEESKFYQEATGTIIFVTSNGSSTIPFGSRIPIAQGISVGQIPNLITDFYYEGGSRINAPWPAHTLLKIQTNTDWPICLFINLQRNYVPLIYFTCIVFFTGLLILGREIFTFISKDFGKYFRSG